MSRAVDYWKERARKEEELSRKRDRNVSKELEDLYNLYIKEIEKQIYAMEKRFAEKKGLTVAELKKLTDQYDVQAFNAKAAKYVKERNFTDEANKELSWYNFTMRLNRLEAIKAELSLEMLALASEEIKATGNFLDAEYLYRLKSQANILGVSIPTDLTLRNKARAIVDSNFEGAVWSERIWGRQQKLRDLVVKTVSDLLILGKNPTTAIPAIRRAFDVSVFEAKRLAVTEGARVAMTAQKNIMKANGFDYYIYLPETSACKICKPLDEKVFRLDDMQSGKNAPPMHPFCKCTIASHYADGNKYNDGVADGVLNQARRVGEKVAITDQAISKVPKVIIPGYTSAQNGNLQLMHKQLLTEARDKNNSNELMYILLGETPVKIFGNQTEVDINSSADARFILNSSNRQTLTALHNHPGGSTFSLNDFNFFMGTPSIKTLTIVTNTGRVMYVTKTEAFDFFGAVTAIKTLDLTDEKYVEKAIKSMYNYGIRYKLR
ncbi:minor capsid protein [Streptococcus danieliae]|uniref:minor capsid protein n=1 Tax=Streptococcus danieliae TaxID=747656 RepID=UPI0021C5B4F5|nr:minor capsid protein [Streptococcus danieliae]MCU0081869.1 minor capsid protein [Streptococcus danieliae]